MLVYNAESRIIIIIIVLLCCVVCFKDLKTFRPKLFNFKQTHCDYGQKSKFFMFLVYCWHNFPKLKLYVQYLHVQWSYVCAVYKLKCVERVCMRNKFEFVYTIVFVLPYCDFFRPLLLLDDNRQILFTFFYSYNSRM